MNKRLLIKNIEGNTTEAERRSVMEWIAQNEENKIYYINLVNLIATQELTNTQNHHFSRADLLDRLNKVKSAVIEPKKNRNSKLYISIAVAASLLLLLSLVGNIYQYNNKSVVAEEYPINNNSKSEVINTFYTERGVKGKIILEDSTVVWLNSDSKITYPQHFASECRRIEFEGEGFFHVKENSEWPMIVTTAKGLKIKVLGTQFHIKSYNNDDEEQTTLFSGNVELTKEIKGKKGKESRRVIKMTPNETIIFDKNYVKSGAEKITLQSDTTKKVAWKRGELLFEETPLKEVVKMLERWHGAKIVVKESSIYQHNFTGSFASESLVQILELIRFTSSIDYSIEDNIVYLYKKEV